MIGLMEDKTKAAIPKEMLEKLYMPRKTKEDLASSICPDCGTPLEVIDT